ncbi:AAA family ATPase [Erysipelothrix aquatica]|uniref:AAA family ATPase n=1 Tax=Erysipelothrix aquatica TaxID=2683714 RepID=UPI00135A86F0|nr:AAA family ATPase [Erysipelothrix aquatica]
MTQIVVIRGNSGSGKTTIAHMLREHYTGSTMILSQDVIRREILNVKDTEGNLSAALIVNMLKFGLGKYDLIVIEGIFNSWKYQEMFREITALAVPTYFYYFDLSFEASYSRHLMKDTAEFGLDALKRWWVKGDLLSNIDETLLNEQQDALEITHLIINTLNAK